MTFPVQSWSSHIELFVPEKIMSVKAIDQHVCEGKVMEINNALHVTDRPVICLIQQLKVEWYVCTMSDLTV